ncbi:MAG: M20 family metallopeptidase [Planctomycetes bacterium]|nr:M20 family metallopeptidase [Planctomycetota bacterium]
MNTEKLASDAVRYTQEMVKIESLSGEEHEISRWLKSVLDDAGVYAELNDRNVIGVKGTGEPRMLFNSHHDVVPPGEGWTRDPYSGIIENGVLHGRGSTDAKSSLGGMLSAFLHAEVTRGTLIFTGVYEEETYGKGVIQLAARLKDMFEGGIHGVIVGEPTENRVCIGQRGLLRIKLHSKGQQCHAARPWQGVNAMYAAARDILKIEKLDAESSVTNEVLGRTTFAATVVQGGTKPNVVPHIVTTTLDVRTIPEIGNEKTIEMIRREVESEVEVVSKRYMPVITDKSERIVTISEAVTKSEAMGFGGVSDLFFLRDYPCLVLGPGSGKQSHTVDEFITLDYIEAAAKNYAEIARRFLAG